MGMEIFLTGLTMFATFLLINSISTPTKDAGIYTMAIFGILSVASILGGALAWIWGF